MTTSSRDLVYDRYTDQPVNVSQIALNHFVDFDSQVCNGGIEQWVCNGFIDGLGSVVETLKLVLRTVASDFDPDALIGVANALVDEDYRDYDDDDLDGPHEAYDRANDLDAIYYKTRDVEGFWEAVRVALGVA